MITYHINEPKTLDSQEILAFLRETDELITPRLSVLVVLEDYAKKITDKAVIFTARDDDKLIGLSAIYFNKAPEYSYSTYIMVKREYQQVDMVGIELSSMVKNYIKNNGSTGLRFEIRKTNTPLLKYNLKRGAKIISESKYPGTDEVSVLMELTY